MLDFSLPIVTVLIYLRRYILESRLRDVEFGIDCRFILATMKDRIWGCRSTWQLVIRYSRPIVSSTEWGGCLWYAVASYGSAGIGGLYVVGFRILYRGII